MESTVLARPVWRDCRIRTAEEQEALVEAANARLAERVLAERDKMERRQRRQRAMRVNPRAPAPGPHPVIRRQLPRIPPPCSAPHPQPRVERSARPIQTPQGLRQMLALGGI